MTSAVTGAGLRWPWPSGAATGVGSWPGTDPAAASAAVVDLLPDLPHLPELPGRGPWADVTGRGVALLPGLGAELAVSGWRLVPRGGSDLRRAQSMLSEDLDAFEERLAGYHGVLKLQVVGPVTLAATLELASGHAAVTDGGARRDLAQSLAEGVGEHVAELARRVPAARYLVQLDEPALPICLAGELPTASGFSRVRAVPAEEAQRWVARVIGAAVAAGAREVGDQAVWPLVHCCDPRVPVARLVAAGARGLSVDLTHWDLALDDELGAALEAGVGLLAGVVSTHPGPSDPPATVGPVRSLWHRLGLSPDQLSSQVVVTPTCGVGGLTPSDAAAAYGSAVRGARLLADEPEAGA